MRLAPGLERDRAATGSRTGPGSPPVISARTRLWALRERVRRGRAIGRGARDRDHPRHRHPRGDRLPARSYARPRRCRSRSPARCAPRATTDWDGPRNLLDAATVAASARERGPGHHGGVRRPDLRRRDRGEDPRHRSRRLLPRRTRRRSAGWSTAGCVRRPPPGARPPPVSPAGLDARVALVPLVVGDDGTMLDLARPRARRRGGRGVRQRQRAARRGAGHAALARRG